MEAALPLPAQILRIDLRTCMHINWGHDITHDRRTHPLGRSSGAVVAEADGAAPGWEPGPAASLHAQAGWAVNSLGRGS